MREKFTALQLATIAILDNALAYDWSVQGFGMLRLYIRKVGRLHIWDYALRYPNVSMVHNHSWDLESQIIFGSLMNTRFVESKDNTGIVCNRQRLITGYDTKMVSPIGQVKLVGSVPEIYVEGTTYSQKAYEIHRTDADDGTVTLMARDEDENGQADVYWPVGVEWGTAKPRKATKEEIAATILKVRVML